MARPDLPGHDLRVKAYRLLHENAQSMLTAALEERWEDLAALQARRQDCMFEIRKVDQGYPDVQSDELSLLMLAILECDEQTGQLIKNYQSELLSTFDTSRKLANAYRAL